MAGLTSNPQGAGQALFTSSAKAFHSVGEMMVTADGRKFRYAKAGATLVKGNWLQSPAQLVNHQGLTPVAAAIGSTQVTVALGATAVTANQYAGGWAIVTVTPDLGGIYAISGHPAADLSTSVVLTLSDPLLVAWTTSSRIDLIPNPYSGVIQFPITTATGVAVGVACSILTSGEFGWIQTGGIGAGLTAGSTAVGEAVVLPGSAAGAAVVDSAAAATPIVGIMMETGAAGETNAIKILLD